MVEPDSPYDEYGYLREVVVSQVQIKMPRADSQCGGMPVGTGPEDQDAASRLTEVVSVALGPDD